MKEAVQQFVVADTLDYLMTLVRDGVRPEEARSGFRPLQRRYSEVGMQLIWEQETYDGSVHYDALVNLPGSGTVSISYCDDRAKPWPLRGVARWSDSDVVRVNDTVLSMDQAVACLDFVWEESRITDRLVNVCLIQQELEKNPIEISNQELQAAMDGFRRARKLFTADDTHRWMERRGITHHELEQLVSSLATTVKLRDEVVGDRVDDYFTSHSEAFDVVHVARIVLCDEAEAVRLAERIRNHEADFNEAAQDSFIAASGFRKAKDGDFFVSMRQREAPAEICTSLFESSPGSIVGPVREGENHVIFRIISVVRATLDDTTRDAIKNILFEEWLEQRRSAASVEWLWGNCRSSSGS
jgi:putative peptide maturation system protein